MNGYIKIYKHCIQMIPYDIDKHKILENLVLESINRYNNNPTKTALVKATFFAYINDKYNDKDVDEYYDILPRMHNNDIQNMFLSLFKNALAYHLKQYYITIRQNILKSMSNKYIEDIYIIDRQNQLITRSIT